MATEDDAREEALGELIGRLQDAINAGQRPDRFVWLERHPEFAKELDAFFDADLVVDEALATAADSRGGQDPPGEGRLDLKVFPIRRRLKDIPLGTVHELRSLRNEVKRELVVLRGWLTPKERERIESSLRAIARIETKVFARVLETGRMNRVPFVLREHLTEPTLAEIARRLRHGASTADFESCRLPAAAALVAKGESMPIEVITKRLTSPRNLQEVMRAFALLAEDLDAAHAVGVCHRGIEPELIAMPRQRRPRIQGLGLSWCDARVAAERLTDWRPCWLAPEVVDDTWAPATWLSDVYGFGMALAHVVGLEEPLDGRSAAECWVAVGVGRTASDLVQKLPSGLPGGLRRLITALVETRPSNRPRRLAEAAAELRSI